MCNVGPHKIMQEGIRWYGTRSSLTSARVTLKRMHLVSRRSRGTATIEMLLYDNLIAGAANEAEETNARVSKSLFM